MKQRSVVIAALVLALLVSALGAGVPAYAASGTAEPESGPPGTTFTFRASGLGSSEPVGVWLVRPDGSTRQPDSGGSDSRQFSTPEGTLEWSWTADDLAPGGQWQAVARGDASRVEVVIPFTVENPTQGNQPPYSWMVLPEEGPPGTTFTFVGRSPAFIPGEQVGTWFIQPNGEPFNVDQGVSVDPNGQIFRLWKAPPDAYGGEWIFRAVGISSGYNIDMRFRITDAPPPPPPEVVDVPLEVTPERGPPGTVFTFRAGGFVGGEQVSTWLVLPNEESLDAASWIFADADGVVTWEWASPADAPGGVWNFWLRGSQTTLRENIPFTIEGDIPVPEPRTAPPGSVTPQSGPPDTPFYFSAEGFDPNEYVLFWEIDPNGEPYPEHEQLRADDQGRLEWRWDAPNSSIPGQWMMVVRGKVSDIKIQIPFTVEPVPSEAPITVEPAAGSPGVVLDFEARGYNSGEIIDTWASGPGGTTYELERDTANRRGIARWTWRVPADIPEGEWEMIARGRDSRVLRKITIPIYRAAPPETEDVAGVTPQVGPPGTTFTFYGTGYERRKLVGYWLTRPDGQVVRTNDMPHKEADEIRADVNGRVEISWTAPPDAQRGTWVLTMRTSNPGSTQEDITHAIPFTVE
jgi:hypothetical protein